jgi:hypothetical protein
MAGRRTFFSFHYQRDVWRASIVRKAGVVDAQAAAGWSDASIWEEARSKGDEAVHRLVNKALDGTTVTVVLIGAETRNRKYVRYEIEQSLKRNNGVLGIYIHNIKDQNQKVDAKGQPPQTLIDNKFPCYEWDPQRLGTWVEKAAIRAGHPCLSHNRVACGHCG